MELALFTQRFLFHVTPLTLLLALAERCTTTMLRLLRSALIFGCSLLIVQFSFLGRTFAQCFVGFFSNKKLLLKTIQQACPAFPIYLQRNLVS